MNTLTLVKKLHQLSDVELFLSKHPELSSNSKLFHQYITSLSSEESAKYLFPLVDSYKNTGETRFPTNYFFATKNYNEIIINQHTRFSPPILHSHGFYEMLIVYEGQFTQTINHQEIMMKTGDVCIIPPDIFHSLSVKNSSIVLNVLIQKETFQNIFFKELHGDNILANFYFKTLNTQKRSNYVIFHTLGDTNISRKILAMYLETINKDSYYQQVVQADLMKFLIYLLRHYSKSADNPSFNNKDTFVGLSIINYINDHTKTVTLSFLSEHFHYSKQTISNIIKKQSGLSYAKYVQQQRIQNAKSFLTQTNMKVQEIGEEVGYPTVEHFIRLFKKVTKKTPSEYRKLQ